MPCLICIRKSIELAKMIEDEQEQAFVIAGILVCSDKFIDREYAKEWMIRFLIRFSDRRKLFQYRRNGKSCR